MPADKQVVVIGSGPGGGLTACLLAEAGIDVCVLEEGPEIPLQEATAYTRGEIESKYRGGGVTVALGSPQLTYVEGRVIGGGSEINSGLYHRIPADILGAWAKEYGLSVDADELEASYRSNEADLEVQTTPAGDVPEASRRLECGARSLDWKCVEVPRWYHYGPGSPRRNSLSWTYVPRARRAGAEFRSGHRVHSLSRDRDDWRIIGRNGEGRFDIRARAVFLCGGAIQTPALLQRSGWRRQVGTQLYAHPTLKLTAEFADVVNEPGSGVPTHQVKEFSPRIGFGCSISRPQFMAVGMLDHPNNLAAVVHGWRRHAVYYCMLHGRSTGSVTAVPGLDEPIVRYSLDRVDAAEVQQGLARLARLLFAAGAVKLYPTIAGSPFLTPENLAAWEATLPVKKSRLRISTIHLLGSCPAGENASRCPVDSRGRVRGADNLFVNDGSMVCSSLGVNPQGAILALARMNALHFLRSGEA